SRKSAGRRAMKAETARMWCAAVNNHGGFGKWGYIELAQDPTTFKSGLGTAIQALYGDGPLTGLHEEGLKSVERLKSDDDDADWGADDYTWDGQHDGNDDEEGK